MKLYYAPGTCALSVHVALIWTGQPYEIEEVELGSEEYKKINPLGAVPALVDGDSKAMSQAESLFHYISAKFPEKKMTGGDSLEERQQYNQWISFLSSDLHPSYGILFRPDRYTVKQDEASLANAKSAANGQLKTMFTVLDNHLAGREFIVGDHLTCADPFAYIMTSWLHNSALQLADFPHLKRHFEKLHEEPGVIRAEKEQGIRKPLAT